MYHTPAHQTHTDEEITIRLATADQAGQIRRIAERDTAAVPAGDLLVALVRDEVRAAVSIRSGDAIADPFQPTDDLVTLLCERAAQLRAPRGKGLRSRLAGRMRGGRGRRRARLSPQPAGTLRAFD